MKKKNVILSFLLVLCLAVFLIAADYSWHQEGKATLGVDGKSWKQIFLGASSDAPIVLEGATSDAYETYLVVTDPTADRTITFPNITGTIVTTGDTGSVSTTMIADDAVDKDKLDYEVASVTVAATATSGTATVTANSVIIGYYPTGNQDQLVDNIAISGTTLTVTLAAAATADNTFNVVLLKP